MLDELGNLQSEGHGISGFQTMLSIGLGQDQQVTLILQTLQQLIDVYGDSVDKVIQGNTSNIIYLKQYRAGIWCRDYWRHPSRISEILIRSTGYP